MKLRPLQHRAIVKRVAGDLYFGHIGEGRRLKDAFVVAFLAILLGSFVAQISWVPKPLAGATAATRTM